MKNFQFWFRIGMMCISLLAVLWVRHTLKQYGLNKNLETAVGVNPTSARVDLCETRVTRIRASGIELYENGMKWMLKKATGEKQVDPISVEKWFGANCSVLADDLRQVALKETQAAIPILTLDFIQGASQAVKQTASGQFIWKQIAFHSQQLADALRELPELREAGPHGRPRPQSAKNTED